MDILGLSDRVGILKLGTTWPLPRGFLKIELQKCDRILFAEDVDPFVEDNVKSIAVDMCREIGKCIQKDDMSGVLEKMERSQLWVLGTPVYWWGPTAQFKAFIDRWYGAKHTKFEGRHVILTMPLAGGNTSYARHTVGMLTDVLNWQKTELTATILAPGVFNAGDVRNHTDVMMQAFQAGQKAMTIVR